MLCTTRGFCATRAVQPRTAVGPCCPSRPARVASAAPRHSVKVRWATRLQELELEDSKEYKIAAIAEALGVSEQLVAGMVAIRPGLLLLQPQSYKQKVHKISLQHNIPLDQASQLAVSNPTLLFDA